jgi:RND family efflux transporter MFP subunit
LVWFSVPHGVNVSAYAAESLAQQELDCLLEPRVKINIGAAVAGLISSVMVDRGDVVKAGQVVATLESGVEEANVALGRAKANDDFQVHSNQARADFLRRKASRHEQLRLTHATPEATFDEAETDAKMAEFATQEASLNLNVAQLELKRQEEMLKLRTIRSPIDGVVAERVLFTGAYTHDDSHIMTVAQIDPLNVEVFVPIAFYAQTRVGDEADIFPESPVGGRFLATVTIVDHVLDAASGTFGVRLELPNPEHRIPAGVKCKIRFKHDQTDSRGSDAEGVAEHQNAKLPPAAPGSHDQIAWALVKETTDDETVKRFIAQYPRTPLRKEAEARIAALAAAWAAKPVPPSPDEVTWLVLAETTDEAAIKRFIAQYPTTPLRKEAEARIAALAAARAAKPVLPGPDEVAWLLPKETADASALTRSIAQYPNGALHNDAEARIAVLEAQSSRAVGVNPIDSRELVRSLQSELKQLGCFSGPVDGELNDATRAAERMFAKLSSIKIPDALTLDTIKTLSGISKQICPLVCPGGVRTAGGRCISRTVASDKAARSNAAKPKSKHRETTNFDPSHQSAN